MKMFIYAMLVVAYFFGLGMMINDVNKEAVTSETTTEPCCLQDAVMHDGEWFLYDVPCVFDEYACEVMSQIFRDEVNFPVAATAEFINGCYVIHLD